MGKLNTVTEAVSKAFSKGAKAVTSGAKTGIKAVSNLAESKMASNVVSGAGAEAIEDITKKAARANTIKGSLIGGVGGAGLGGLTGVVTGADEDNQKAMTVGGAIGGAVIGGFTGRVLGARPIIQAATDSASAASASTALALKADDAVEVANNIARKNATTGYAGISHTNNLRIASSTNAVAVVDAFDDSLRTYDGGFRHSISGGKGPALLGTSDIIDSVAQDIVPESHRLGGTLSLPGAVAMDGGQMLIG